MVFAQIANFLSIVNHCLQTYYCASMLNRASTAAMGVDYLKISSRPFAGKFSIPRSAQKYQPLKKFSSHPNPNLPLRLKMAPITRKRSYDGDENDQRPAKLQKKTIAKPNGLEASGIFDNISPKVSCGANTKNDQLIYQQRARLYTHMTQVKHLRKKVCLFQCHCSS